MICKDCESKLKNNVLIVDNVNIEIKCCERHFELLKDRYLYGFINKP